MRALREMTHCNHINSIIVVYVYLQLDLVSNRTMLSHSKLLCSIARGIGNENKGSCYSKIWFRYMKKGQRDGLLGSLFSSQHVYFCWSATTDTVVWALEFGLLVRHLLIGSCLHDSQCLYRGIRIPTVCFYLQFQASMAQWNSPKDLFVSVLCSYLFLVFSVRTINNAFLHSNSGTHKIIARMFAVCIEIHGGG